MYSQVSKTGAGHRDSLNLLGSEEAIARIP